MSVVPRIWSRFTKSKNGKEFKTRIEELSDDKFEESFKFWFKFYVPDEPLHKASKIIQRPEALEEYKEIMRMSAKHTRHQIDVCYLEGTGEEKIVAMSIMVLEKKNKDFDEFEVVKSIIKTEELKTMFQLCELVDDKSEIFEKFNAEVCYMGRELAVDTDYRGLGIAGEMLKARSIVCKEHKVPVTSAWMTSIGTQKAAAKLGWEVLRELRYKDLEQQVAVKFEEDPATTKLMVVQV